MSTQAAFARSKLDAVPSRDAFRTILSSNWDYAKLSAPARRGEGADEWYYFHWNSGLQNQYELRRIKVDDYAEAMKSEGDRTDGPPSAPGELFFDPNKLSTDGTVSLSSSSFSESGRLWAYGVSVSGSDWFTIKVRRTEGAFESQDDALSLEDEVRFAKFTGISWTHDEKGAFIFFHPSSFFLQPFRLTSPCYLFSCPCISQVFSINGSPKSTRPTSARRPSRTATRRFTTTSSAHPSRPTSSFTRTRPTPSGCLVWA